MKARLAEFGAASGVQDGVVARDYGRVFAGRRQNVIARERVAGLGCPSLGRFVEEDEGVEQADQ